MGSFYLAKGKAFKKGEKLSKLGNAFRNHIPIPLANCKRIKKILFQKGLQKQAKWCKCGPKC
jgi:hypothetical protein